MKKCFTLLIGLFLALTSFRSAETRKPVIFMIGDSTMANKPLTGDNPERGWGQMLPGFLSDDIVVDNHAVNGRSSKSFIDEGRWVAVLEKIQPGDYVFIQFGHNDEKPKADRHTDPGSTFDDNLRRFVNETRAKGGKPVLFNSIVRRNFGKPDASADALKAAVNQDDAFYVNPDAKRDPSGEKEPELPKGATLIDTHGAYLDSPRNVARELNVPFVDMNLITKDLIEGLGPEASKSLFVWVEPNTVAAIPKGREDNTHLNIHGARVITGLTIDAIGEAVPELKPYIRHYDFVVAKDGSGDFITVQEAIDAVPDFRKNTRTTILVRPGEYKERVVIPESKINVSLIGQEGAVITDDAYAQKLNRFGEEMGTSGSATVYIYSPDFYAENMTFANTAGRVGQAVACFVSGDRAFFKNCRFLGNQDTLYTYGKQSRQYYEDCYIEGTVDFIFGTSTAVFNRCKIHSLADGYLTAPSTKEGERYGYVFYDCDITAEPGVNRVYLSRPWRPFAKAVFIRCKMGDHIVAEGWNNWGKAENEKTVGYAEYQSSGPGANPSARAPFSRQLPDLKGYSIADVLGDTDGWDPSTNGTTLIDFNRQRNNPTRR